MNDGRANRVSRRVVVAALCGVACLWAASAGFAQPSGERGERRFGAPGGFGHGGGGAGRRLVEFLELTEVQQDEWKAAHEAHRDANAVLMDDVKANREELQAAIESANPDATEIGELTLAGYDLRQQIKASFEILQEDLKAILTPEQLDRYEAFQAANGPHRRGPRGGRGGRGSQRLDRASRGVN